MSCSKCENKTVNDEFNTNIFTTKFSKNSPYSFLNTPYSYCKCIHCGQILKVGEKGDLVTLDTNEILTLEKKLEKLYRKNEDFKHILQEFLELYEKHNDNLNSDHKFINIMEKQDFKLNCEAIFNAKFKIFLSKIKELLLEESK